MKCTQNDYGAGESAMGKPNENQPAYYVQADGAETYCASVYSAKQDAPGSKCYLDQCPGPADDFKLNPPAPGNLDVEFAKKMLSGTYLPYDEEQEASLLIAAANAGVVQAQLETGERYMCGHCCAMDDSKAVGWFLVAAGDGCWDAIRRLGYYYTTGSFSGAECDATVVQIPALVPQQFPPKVVYNRARIADFAQRVLRSADSGSAEDKYIAGQCFNCGCGVQRDFDAAKQYYQAAVARQYNAALCGLARCYMETGVNSDKHLGYTCFRRAADKNIPEALCGLARCLYGGIGVQRDIERAVTYYGQAIQYGFSDAMVNLAVLGLTGQIQGFESTDALQLLQRAANVGNVAGQFNLALALAACAVTANERAAVVYWLTRAAHRGFAPAVAELGRCYALGFGVDKNYYTALEHFQAAAQCGDAPAQHSLAECYRDGKGVEKDISYAIHWFQRASDQNYAPSHANLALCLIINSKHTYNLTKAFALFYKAAHAGIAIAYYNLAICYYSGCGTQIDYVQAARWYETAAQQGYVKAAEQLAYMLRAGIGVPRNIMQAYAWEQRVANAVY